MKASPTLTADLRRGNETQVLLELQKAGVEPDDYAAIATNEALRSELVSVILKHRIFASPDDQVKSLLGINEQVWKDSSITEAAIKALGIPPQWCPVSDPKGLFCVTLLYETGDALKTFEHNWVACKYIHGEERTWKWADLIFASGTVKPRANALPRKLGLRWAVVELGRAFQNKRIPGVREMLDSGKVMGMGQEGPLIAALHPRWARAMNGTTIPYMDLPDLEVMLYERHEFDYAPFLRFDRDDDKVVLCADDMNHPSSNYGSGSLRYSAFGDLII